MSATNPLAADDTRQSTLLTLMEAPNRRRNWRFGRSLQFHGPSWSTLSSAEVTALLQRPAQQRPHFSLHEIARLLGDSRRDDGSQAGST